MSKTLHMLIDYDGCFSYGEKNDKDLGKNLISKNKNLFDHINKQIKENGYEKVYVKIFSGRQDIHTDSENANSNRNGSCYPWFPLITEEIKKNISDNKIEVKFDPTLLGDIDFEGKITEGKTYEEAIKILTTKTEKTIAPSQNKSEEKISTNSNRSTGEINFSIDAAPFKYQKISEGVPSAVGFLPHTKAELLYFFAQRAAAEKNESGDILIYDDNEDILKGIYDTYTKDKSLLPKGTKVKLILYKNGKINPPSKKKKSDFIKGEGEKNPDYLKHLLEINQHQKEVNEIRLKSLDYKNGKWFFSKPKMEKIQKEEIDKINSSISSENSKTTIFLNNNLNDKNNTFESKQPQTSINKIDELVKFLNGKEKNEKKAIKFIEKSLSQKPKIKKSFSFLTSEPKDGNADPFEKEKEKNKKTTLTMDGLINLISHRTEPKKNKFNFFNLTKTAPKTLGNYTDQQIWDVMSSKLPTEKDFLEYMKTKWNENKPIDAETQTALTWLLEKLNSSDYSQRILDLNTKLIQPKSEEKNKKMPEKDKNKDKEDDYEIKEKNKKILEKDENKDKEDDYEIVEKQTFQKFLSEKVTELKLISEKVTELTSKQNNLFKLK